MKQIIITALKILPTTHRHWYYEQTLDKSQNMIESIIKENKDESMDSNKGKRGDITGLST